MKQMDYVETITMERLKKVVGKKVKIEGKLIEEIDYDTGGISESVNYQGGGDFIYCELMPYNQAFMDEIKASQSSEALVALWRDIAENSFLNWYVNAEIPGRCGGRFHRNRQRRKWAGQAEEMPSKPAGQEPVVCQSFGDRRRGFWYQ